MEDHCDVGKVTHQCYLHPDLFLLPQSRGSDMTTLWEGEAMTVECSSQPPWVLFSSASMSVGCVLSQRRFHRMAALLSWEEHQEIIQMSSKLGRTSRTNNNPRPQDTPGPSALRPLNGLLGSILDLGAEKVSQGLTSLSWLESQDSATTEITRYGQMCSNPAA